MVFRLMKDEPLTKHGIGQRSALWLSTGRFLGKQKKTPEAGKALGGGVTL